MNLTRTFPKLFAVQSIETYEPGILSRKIEDIAVRAVTDSKAIQRSLPDVAAHVLELCQLTYTDAARVEKAVSKDPFISGQLVSVANSAMFAPRIPIVGVRDAVVRLGLDNVCDIVMMIVSNSTMYRVRGFEKEVEVLRQRGLAAALAARAMSRLMRADPADYAFLAGLMHDIGELVLLERCATLGGVTPEVMSDENEGPVVRATIARLHTELGAAVCRIWKLPPSVVDSTLFHHNCHKGENRYLTTALVAAADRITEHMGLREQSAPLNLEDALFTNLKLTPDQVRAVIAETERTLPSLSIGH
jgi:HD-like signal output (HDOD) protein